VSKNAEPLLRKESRFSDGECFFAEMIKGNATARWA